MRDETFLLRLDINPGNPLTFIEHSVIFGRMAKIGIKLADGKFYPILDEHGSTGKTLVLTTASDGQVSAQIDFYRNDEVAADEMWYIGSLVVDGLSQKYAGETSVDLRVYPAGDGRILAEAYEIDGTGGTQKLEIDIQGLGTENSDNDGKPCSGVRVAAKRRFGPIIPVIIAAVIFLAAAVVFMLLFVLQGCPSQPNVYANPPVREEPIIEPSAPVRDESAGMPEIPPSALPQSNDRDNGSARQTAATGTDIPDMSRKALRTETVR
jgi:hypothetical protein